MINVQSFFRNPSHYQAALVHRSYLNENIGFTSNERLEFLGDAVLTFVVSERLFHLFPDLPEGELTTRRSSLVQSASLAQKAKLLGLDSELLLSRGEQDLGGRLNPNLLEDTFEAVMGALYLDSGLEACSRLLSEVFTDEEISSLKETKDPKSQLQELVQAKGEGTPIYQLLSSTGPDHAKTFTVGVFVNSKQLAEGIGASKQKAEIEAAKTALNLTK